ncbi:MAG TPA: heme-binding beta-barrel domain-containing protein [Acidimicrobiales bacterium]|nr:heme-binding beta-barrel domain-containing protein [Acidimicrobiales bacterium]
MSDDRPKDIFTEPDADPDTLANLGPLRPLAGVWTSDRGLDTHPVAVGAEESTYVEHYELQPIDAQTNGPQLFYGLRYHTHILEVSKQETFHDQVGYWLWEPATNAVVFTLGIPRAQVAIAGGSAEPASRDFEVRARRGHPVWGISSGPFLDEAFRTLSFRLHVTIESDMCWSYEQETVLQVQGVPEPFGHTDRNRLTKVAEPTPNPMALV